MRVVIVITRSDTIGGAHIHVRDLGVGLRQRGLDVKVLVGAEGPFTDLLEESGVPYQSLRYLKRELAPIADAKGLRELRHALSSLKPDIVATHSSKAGIIGRVAARMNRIPATFTAHGWSFTEGKRPASRVFYRWLEKAVARYADRIITVSDFDRELALSHGVGHPAQLVSIHNGVGEVSAELFASAGRQPCSIVMVARHDHQKDHATILRALARLKHLEWTVDFVGDGPLEDENKALSVELGLAERINFLGRRTDVAEIMARSQLLALISNWEGFPLTVLEGMRARLPVVASDVGGTNEAVVDGQTGFLIPRGNVDAVADRLGTLIKDPSMRVEMGSRGRENYERRFTLDTMVERTARVYEEVLAGHVVS